VLQLKKAGIPKDVHAVFFFAYIQVSREAFMCCRFQMLNARHPCRSHRKMEKRFGPTPMPCKDFLSFSLRNSLTYLTGLKRTVGFARSSMRHHYADRR
jgi:hypothetical protein